MPLGCDQYRASIVESPATHRSTQSPAGRLRPGHASGEVEALPRLFHEDAVLLADGGGKVSSALNPIRCADRIARFFVGVLRKFGGEIPDLRSEFTEFSGQPGIATYSGERIDQVLTIATDGERISAVYVVRNLEKPALLQGSGALQRLGGTS